MTEEGDLELAALVSFASLSATTPRDIELIRSSMGSLSQGWQSTAQQLTAIGANPELGIDRRKSRSLSYAKEAIDACAANAIGVVEYWSDLYPVGLRRLAKPPLCIYVEGAIRDDRGR